MAALQIGECRPVGPNEPNQISSVATDGKNSFPRQLEFECDYYCRNLKDREELVIGRYLKVVESQEDEQGHLECEGKGNENIFFSRLSESQAIRDWANHSQIPYEGPYNGELTRQTKVVLAEAGKKLSALKAYIPSQAGRVLMEIGSETDAGNELFSSYLQLLRQGAYNNQRLQTVDDWVLHFIALYGRHLF